jgi:hypothetical protein
MHTLAVSRAARPLAVTFAVTFTLLGAASAGADPVKPATAPAAKPPATQAPNTLSAKEKAAGWRLLFDGKTTKGWRGFGQQKFPDEGWLIKDGVLMHVASPTPGKPMGGDILTVDEFDNFELTWEFKLTPGANGGIKYLVDEKVGHAPAADGTPAKESKSGVSFEYQLLDDDKHPDAKKGKDGDRRCGALYDLIAPKEAAARPIGEWNEARLVVDGNKIEHWLNGKKVVEFERGSEALKKLIAESKYKSIAGFGESAKGHLLIQDHFNEVAYRSLKLRKLPSTKTASR